MAVRRREPGGLRLNLANGLGFLAVFLVVGRWEPAGGSLRSPLYALYARAERNGRAFSVGWTSPRPVGRGPARPERWCNGPGWSGTDAFTASIGPPIGAERRERRWSTAGVQSGN